jgi:hypothetical protein
MSVFVDRHDLVEPLEFKWGRRRGRLAAAMDILSDLAVVLGTHSAYCRAARQSDRPPQDVQAALEHIQHAKELIASLLADAADETPPTIVTSKTAHCEAAAPSAGFAAPPAQNPSHR